MQSAIAVAASTESSGKFNPVLCLRSLYLNGIEEYPAILWHGLQLIRLPSLRPMAPQMSEAELWE